MRDDTDESMPRAEESQPDPKSVSNYLDVLADAAETLMRLDNLPKGTEKHEIEHMLEAEALQMDIGNIKHMENMLLYQTQILHKLFAQATQKYAEDGGYEKTRLFGELALKAQSCCRNTITTLKAIKKEVAALRSASRGADNSYYE